MAVKIPLKNSNYSVSVDDEVYQKLIDDPYLKKINFLENLRCHSRGYAFYQKNWKQPNGTYRNETIYLHKLIAEKFLPRPAEGKLWVRFIDGNPNNCLLSNLEWTSLSNVVRNTTKTDNQYGYRGVVKSGKKYMAIIYVNRKPLNLGTFETPEEAAEAYNKKSIELFGITKSLNRIRK
ncbi:MAG TPA: HNH endonuclease [Salinivirgaceae bacterium]|nr:HNH endonuclease [Salinivirgaceae bacterium]